MSFEKWEISKEVLKDTARVLASGNHEIFVLWTAARNQIGSTCRISRLIVPEQTPESTPYGVAVLVKGNELARIAFDNHRRGEKSVAQLHTHPTADVEMSDLDRRREVIRYVGGLSLIVPWYGRHGLAGFSAVNVYERDHDGWRLWAEEEKERRLVIE